ncbi:MAG: hypothetical protein ACPLRA_07495, partial [Candidatus Saccharicenans sp.]
LDKNKGLLVDVFNQEGTYIDCFYFKFPFDLEAAGIRDLPMALGCDGSCLYTVIKNPDKTYSLQKYKIG